MRKLLTTGLVIVVALLAIALVVKGLLDHSSGQVREKAVARLEQRLAREASAAEENQTTAETARVTVDKQPPRPSREDMRQRWELLVATWKTRMAEPEFREAFYDFHAQVHEVSEPGHSVAELGREDWERWAGVLSQNEDIHRVLLELTDPANPPVAFFGIFDPGPFHDWDALLSGHLLNARQQDDAASMLADLCGLLGLSNTSLHTLFPSCAFENTLACVDLLVPRLTPEELDRLSLGVAVARDRTRFVEHCTAVAEHTVALYDKMPFDSGVPFRSAPQLHGLMWGYRYGLTFLQNKDLARFSDAMEPVLDLAPRPYYRAKPDLARLCEEYDIVPMEEASFFEYVPSAYALSNLVLYAFWFRGLTECFLDQTRLTMDLEAYRREHGAYPDALDALGDHVPVNVITGEPFGYRNRDEGYALWFNAPRDDEDTVWLWPGRMFELKPGENPATRVDQVLEEEAAEQSEQ